MDSIQKFLSENGRKDLVKEYTSKMAAVTKYKRDEIEEHKLFSEVAKNLESIKIDNRTVKVTSANEGPQKKYLRGVVLDKDADGKEVTVAKIYFEIYELVKEGPAVTE